MTDRFEDAVRQAAKGLGTTHEMPTYHDAWQRGRRRRFVKRSALAAAGALVFIAALSVNLGRLPGTSPSEVDEIVVGIEAATPEVPTPLATTAPIQAPTVASSDASATAALPPATTAVPTTGLPTTEPRSTATPAPAIEPTTPPATSAAPPATPVPTAAVVPQVAPTPRPTTAPLQVAPTPTPEAFRVPEATEVPEGATGTQLAPGAGATVPADESSLTNAASGQGQRPDAVILERQGTTPGLECDIDQNGTADAVCELLPDYPCTGNNDVSAGYGSFDDDGDGTIESCRAVGLTMCDTTGDGFADTPCIIELAAEPATSGPAVGE